MAEEHEPTHAAPFDFDGEAWSLNYTNYARVEGDATLAIITCLRCGCALLIDDRDTTSPIELHEIWHSSVSLLPSRKSPA